MSSGLPIVASDLPVHREICGNAALYFSFSSADELAQQVLRTCSDAHERQRLVGKGKIRLQQFSWSRHVDELLRIAKGLLKER